MSSTPRNTPAMHAAPALPFGILTRNFVVTFMNQLSRVATRVYAMLRTWCVSTAGAASDWRPIRVAKLAADLGWSDRHVRRGLAELERCKLIERVAQFDEEEDGTRTQRENRYRVLPEPGLPEPATTAAPPPPPKVVQIEEEDEEIAVEVERVVADVVESIPEWTDDLIAAAQRTAQDAAQHIETLLADPLEAERWYPDVPLTISHLREEITRANRRHQELAALRSLPAVGQAASATWRDQVVQEVEQRVARRLRAQGYREKRITRANAAIVRPAVARYLAVGTGPL